jgi:nickel superoxide dismutase
VPCGIYDDTVRFVLMREHVTTITKSMQQIDQLATDTPPNWNQIVRWTQNKEDHADELAHIITYYFMAQRVKPKAAADAEAHAHYVGQLEILHRMLVAAMKAKQSTDRTHTDRLGKLIDQFEQAYMHQ